MADIYNRVRNIEKKLDFIMQNMHMKAAIREEAEGSEQVFEGSLKELYNLARSIKNG